MKKHCEMRAEVEKPSKRNIGCCWQILMWNISMYGQGKVGKNVLDNFVYTCDQVIFMSEQ